MVYLCNLKNSFFKISSVHLLLCGDTCILFTSLWQNKCVVCISCCLSHPINVSASLHNIECFSGRDPLIMIYRMFIIFEKSAYSSQFSELEMPVCFSCVCCVWRGNNVTPANRCLWHIFFTLICSTWLRTITNFEQVFFPSQFESLLLSFVCMTAASWIHKPKGDWLKDYEVLEYVTGTCSPVDSKFRWTSTERKVGKAQIIDHALACGAKRSAFNLQCSIFSCFYKQVAAPMFLSLIVESQKETQVSLKIW